MTMSLEKTYRVYLSTNVFVRCLSFYHDVGGGLTDNLDITAKISVICPSENRNLNINWGAPNPLPADALKIKCDFDENP